MGVSTDAILFYGYCWEDDVDLLADYADADEGDAPEWEEVVLRKRGVTSPWETPEGQDANNRRPGESYENHQRRSKAWVSDNRKALDDYYEAKRAVNAEFGVELGRHCSGEYAMPYLTVPEAETTAGRGNPEEVKSLAVDPEWAPKLDRWLAELGIEKPHEAPKWWLVSYWG